MLLLAQIRRIFFERIWLFTNDRLVMLALRSQQFSKNILAGLLTLASALVLGGSVAGCSKTTEPTDVYQSYIHIRPAWSPDGSTIAFTGLVRDTLGIYLVDTTGANLRLLRPGDGIGVTWSPDSRWIAFSSNDSLIAMTVTGDSVRPLTAGGSIRPSWSPDGFRIAFVKQTTGLSLLNVGSGAVVSLNRSRGDFPSWNPLTLELVYLEADPYASSQGILYEFKALDIPADTARVLWTSLSQYTLGFSSISPKGTELLVTLAGQGAYYSLHSADVLLKTSKRLTDDGGDYGAWSPDGGRIVYTRTQEGDGALWIMYADGSGKRRLTSP